MLPQQYCLRWRYHHSNLQTMFSQLLQREAFCDVTLACEGKTIKAHKIVLSACSTYFDTILSQYERKDPILIMKDVKYVDMKCLVEFMYKGEINVDHCHLATLLKTAEELNIKGLAEVSWRDDDSQSTHRSTINDSTNNQHNGIQSVKDHPTSPLLATPPVTTTALPHVSAVIDPLLIKTSYHEPSRTSPNSSTSSLTINNNIQSSNKRKRGRPPMDDYEQTFSASTKKNNFLVDGDGSNDEMSNSDHELSICEEQDMQGESGTDEPLLRRVKREHSPQDDELLIDESDEHYSLSDLKQDGSGMRSGSIKSLTTNVTTSSSQTFLTPALEHEWSDVIKMNDYLNTGRRQQFWEEPFTKRVMDAIKTKNLEMKVAAELLGVSYGTLYGRYRDSYGCLKHPYRVRDFWTEQGPTDVLLKLKKKEITLYRAAEQLNVTPQTLSNYLVSMSQIDSEIALNNQSSNNHLIESYEENSDDDGDSVLPDLTAASVNNSLFKNLLANVLHSTSPPITSKTGSVLANCPDITIIKKEKGEKRVNNNSEHSDSNSDQNK